ncbi:catalase [Parapedobacter deserti]|uniref:Catalase n=1 Tax=Parapedobacter deserti TaxID=1912957 RepID=A0ABV7JQE1_9SPHI
MTKKTATNQENSKKQQLAAHTEDGRGQYLTTNQGVRINDNQNSLKAGARGPSLLEDFILREKLTHFDHERIPERVVHARGSAAHGVFQVYQSMANYTKAGFLQDASKQTPVFVRFSTVVGFRGSTDLARDVRGFAVKFYTEEGIFDLVGNNIPVFFIQDAMKFPDLVHSIKPEPHNEIPQATAAHDTFWDFVSLMPEATHMVMWAMSDRAIPRSYRMMEGFGVHTFRFINEAGKSTFVKFHWKPMLGMHAVAWDEAQKISGADPDFHRRDLWEAIEKGMYPEWELGVQLVAEEDEHAFPFDLLDPTKIIPEEMVPVTPIGKLTLNRNPDNFFAETEQVAFHPGHIVPGLDFTNDPLLQGRLFSYTDTQLIRLGSPNFHEIPINRSVAPVHNNQRDGHMRQTINKGIASYEPNTVGGGCPFQAKIAEGGFSSYPERVEAHKVRERSASFSDHFSQATLFYRSQSKAEQRHIIGAYSFELGKVNRVEIRQRMLGILAQVDKDLAQAVGENLGLEVPETPEQPINRGVPANADQTTYEPQSSKPSIERSPALSMLFTRPKKMGIATRKIAFLAANGVNDADFTQVRAVLEENGATVQVISPKLGTIKTERNEAIKVDHSFLTASSVLFDAIYVPGGAASIAGLGVESKAIHFINEAYLHCKPIAASKGVGSFLAKTALPTGILVGEDPGLILDEELSALKTAFVDAIAHHRFWDREEARNVPA